MYRINTEFDIAPIESIVGDARTSGRIYVPKEMIGRKVVVACIPEDVRDNVVGMSTEDLITQLTGALGMSMEDWNDVADECSAIGDLESSKYPENVSYNDAVDELLEFVRSTDIKGMTLQQAFCFGAFIGITYHPHMKREFDNKFSSALVTLNCSLK